MASANFSILHGAEEVNCRGGNGTERSQYIYLQAPLYCPSRLSISPAALCLATFCSRQLHTSKTLLFIISFQSPFPVPRSSETGANKHGVLFKLFLRWRGSRPLRLGAPFFGARGKGCIWNNNDNRCSDGTSSSSNDPERNRSCFWFKRRSLLRGWYEMRNPCSFFLYWISIQSCGFKSCTSNSQVTSFFSDLLYTNINIFQVWSNTKNFIW